MNILMISDVYFPRINGVSTSISTFRRELRALGHRVTLIAPEYPGQPYPADETDVIRIPSRYLPMDPEDRMMKWRPVIRLIEGLRSEDYDLVHIQTPFLAHYLGVRIAKRLGIPRVESYHTFFEEYLYHYLPFLPDALMRYAARAFSRSQCNDVDGLVIPSRAMHEALLRYGVTTREAIVPTGMELEDFAGGDGRAFRERLGIAPERPTLVHVGRIAFEKNIDFLLDVVARVRRDLPDLAFIVAGEGPALKHVKRRAAKLGLQDNAFFAGYLDRKTSLLDCYRAGDAFIFASRTETQGLVLLESMAVEVPVVSTAVMGTRDILAPGKGALVAEEDVEDFAGKVIRLLSDQVLHARLAQEAGRYVHEEWSAGAMARRMVDFYQDVIDESRPAGRASRTGTG